MPTRKSEKTPAPHISDPGRDVVAAFDFDGTITRRDTLVRFLFYSSGSLQFLQNMVLEFPNLATFALRRIDNQSAKESLLSRFFRGRPIDDLMECGNAFAQDRVPALLRPAAMDRVSWHQNRGHRCVLISASLDLYIGPWAASAGFDDVLCSRLAVDGNRRFVGRLEGLNCFGAEKVRRLKTIIGDLSSVELFAYGDSEGDLELLREADHAFFRQFGP